MLFVLDAYNIIGKMRLGGNSGDVRRSFLRFLLRHPVSFSKKNRIIVVFDGKRNPDIIVEFPFFEIIFSDDITADERINLLLEKLRPSSGFVVSDDNEVKFYAKKARISSLSVGEFLSWREKEETEDVEVKEQLLSKDEMDEINKELERIWLKKES